MALTLVVLLGFTAFAVDFGVIRSEDRELQNGADAAALAVAQDCAKDASASDCANVDQEGWSKEATALHFATSNTDASTGNSAALDDRVGDPVAVDWAQQTVTVTVRSDPALGLRFAPLLPGGLSESVRARAATAAWMAPYALIPTVPIIIAECEWIEATGIVNDSDPTLPSGEQILFFHSGTGSTDANTGNNTGNNDHRVTCGNGEAGQDQENDDRMTGGFGWLEPNGGGICSADLVTTDDELIAASNSGNGMKTDCYPALLDAYVNGTVLLIPIYSDILCADLTETCSPGQNDKYVVSGFGALRLTGIYFDGSHNAGVGQERCKGNPEAPPGASCLVGEFVAFVAPGETYPGGGDGGADYGTSVVTLIN